MYVNFHNVSTIEKAIYESDDAECSICLGEIINKYTILKCNHVFHKNCINAWLKKHVTCPMCRTYLKHYYEGTVWDTHKFKIGTKFKLILNDTHLIIKYYYKYTNILKKKVEMPFKKIKYFSHSGSYFTYDFYDEDSGILKKETLRINPPLSEIIFNTLKNKVNTMAKNSRNETTLKYENIADL